MCHRGRPYLNLDLEEHHEGLKTSVANSIKRLLGSDNELVRFDDLRFQLKEKLKEAKRAGRKNLHMNTSISEYTELVETMKAKINLVKSKNSAKLKELEMEHYQKHGVLPEKTRGSHYYNILKEKKVASNILSIL